MMVRACSAINCSNRNFPGNPAAFHKFPLRDKVRLKEWVKNMRRKDFSPTHTCYLCSDHFEETSYWKGHSVKLLKDNAVPTIFDFTTSDTKKTRKRRISKAPSKDDSSETDYPTPAKKTTSKCKKKKKNYRTTFSTELVTNNKILGKTLISDTNTESNSEMDSLPFFDKILLDDTRDEIIILNIDSDSDQEADLIKDKYVKADHSYVWPVQSDDVNEATGKQSGVAIRKNRSVKSDDFSKNKVNNKSSIISNDFTDNIPITLDSDIPNCNSMSESQIIKHECKISAVELNNGDKKQKFTDPHLETGILKSLVVTDKQLFEAIKEMGKTNAVILVVKDDTGDKEGYEMGEILNIANISSGHGENISFETIKVVGERIIGIKRKIQEKCAALSLTGQLIGSCADSVKDCDIKETDEFEIGEFRNGGLKIAGEIGKSNAEVIKLLQLQNLEESKDLINTINIQKEEIDRLKKLLQYERLKTEIL